MAYDPIYYNQPHWLAFCTQEERKRRLEYAHERYQRLLVDKKQMEQEFGFGAPEDAVFTDPLFKEMIIHAIQTVADSDENKKQNMPLWRRVMEIVFYPEKTCGIGRRQPFSIPESYTFKDSTFSCEAKLKIQQMAELQINSLPPISIVASITGA